VAVGLAIGVTPLWGLHWLVLLAVCVPLRLDAGVAWIASNVSLPFLAPFLTFAEIQIGARVVRGAWPAVTVADIRPLGARELGAMLRELFVGTVILSPSAAALGGTLAWAVAQVARGSRARP
jgi:uncharacterized protein (DUF2062 family)